MKSNYMRSAEIKIAKNPNMSPFEKSRIVHQAKQKERKLEGQLGILRYGVYTPADFYARNDGLNARVYTCDDYWMHDAIAYDRPLQPTATELTREHIKRLIDEVHATPAREPIYIGTRDGLDAYRIWQTPTTTGTTIDWRREYTGTWEPIFNEVIAQINLPE